MANKTKTTSVVTNHTPEYRCNDETNDKTPYWWKKIKTDVCLVCQPTLPIENICYLLAVLLAKGIMIEIGHTSGCSWNAIIVQQLSSPHISIEIIQRWYVFLFVYYSMLSLRIKPNIDFDWIITIAAAAASNHINKNAIDFHPIPKTRRIYE